ncbi:MAG: bifunctional adenosylcobinamide kinase/adenosylcobinamide-phosphate guanylyltransferase [Clostridia bacterium]|nr:bifunctional adenosylcobinamide kinase/adenosylcobinamide-phosphate guanylyltransferase [Clostridia bacterium]
MRVLLLGGSKSGKSHLAQELCRKLCGNAPLYYWATMQPTDEEDRLRIRKHLEDRAGWGFETVECGRALPAALPEIDPSGTVLFDSLTANLANEMFRENGFDASAGERCIAELKTVSKYAANFVGVCDDLWRDGKNYDTWTESYRKELARICTGLAAEFDVVCEIVCGLPHFWKGELPL